MNLAEFLRLFAKDLDEEHYLNEIPDDEVIEYFAKMDEFISSEAIINAKVSHIIFEYTYGSSSPSCLCW